MCLTSNLVDIVKRQVDEVFCKRRSDIRRFNTLTSLATIALPVLLLLPPLVTLVIAHYLAAIVLSLTQLGVSFLLLMFVFLIWKWTNESQFFVWQIEANPSKKKTSLQDSQELNEIGPNEADISHDLNKSKHDVLKRAKDYLVKQTTAYYYLTAAPIAVLYAANAVWLFLEGHLLSGIVTLILGVIYYLFLLYLFFLLRDTTTPVSTQLSISIPGGGLDYGFVLLPKKVHAGDSHNISTVFKACSDEITETFLKQYASQNEVSDYFLMELQAAGLDVDGDKKVQFGKVEAGAIWNCHFPKAGNFTINLSLSKIFGKERLQFPLFTHEHSLNVVNKFRVFWQPTLGIILLITTIVLNLIPLAEFVGKLTI